MPHETPAPQPAPTPAPDAAYVDLERELRIMLRRAGAVAGSMARRIHPDLDASAYPLLAHVADHPGVRGSELAAHFGVGRATISRQLSRLHGLGLVAREVDPDDSRGQRITLTADGAARLQAAHVGRVQSITEALDGWDERDVAQLATLLHRYSDDVVRWNAAR
ncbi:MarR family winged helix-turn-helix transcriptional regulator [Cellulosimicrobium marinum]|uniref:MarR family winged helix-turn-helix transcriptional regulator n=1 Tax=Cellulosimicrobium marinum TaxID=1638992 RepID=UPI001E317397|nr:MarR family transcriptional regulator [Cellulosimicrobium marinum]MCB7135230.1 MarR family transcriptional regulator [Cellulosimicrobium marinum]